MNWTHFGGFAAWLLVILLFRYPLMWFLGIRGLEQALKEANESLREFGRRSKGCAADSV